MSASAGTLKELALAPNGKSATRQLIPRERLPQEGFYQDKNLRIGIQYFRCYSPG